MLSSVVVALLPLLACVSARVPYHSHSLVVPTTSGAFQGSTNHATSIDSWLGIPYGKNPTGKLRFRAPVAYVTTQYKTIKNATVFGNACPQAPSATVLAPIAEDCLNLNIFRPASVDPREKLPVVLYIFGGGYKSGSASSYNPSVLIQKSVALSKPIMVVTINYRVNTFGFLSSSDLPSADLNNGLRDQHLGLHWVQRNIAGFGGDRRKVTIWGESAGAISVGHLLLFAERGLFRAVIQDSGTAMTQEVPPARNANAAYQFFVEHANCTRSTATERLACLRAAPFSTVQAASVASAKLSLLGYTWGPVKAPGAFVTESPAKRTANRHFNNVPILSGTNLDEGTLFSADAAKVAGDKAGDEFFDFFINRTNTLFPSSPITNEQYAKFNKLYPQDPTVGSPFGTGKETFGLPVIFKRLAALFGDAHFQAPRRYLTKFSSTRQPTYVYHFVGPAPSNRPPHLGTYHSLDLSFLGILAIGLNTTGITNPELAAVKTLESKWQTHYINFVNDLKPGGQWPRYSTTKKSVLQFKTSATETTRIVADDWHLEQTNYLNSQDIINTFELRR